MLAGASNGTTPNSKIWGIKTVKTGNEDSIIGSSNVYWISTMGNSITKPVKSLNLSSNPHYDDPTTTDLNFSHNASLPR